MDISYDKLVDVSQEPLVLNEEKYQFGFKVICSVIEMARGILSSSL